MEVNRRLDKMGMYVVITVRARFHGIRFGISGTYVQVGAQNLGLVGAETH